MTRTNFRQFKKKWKRWNTRFQEWSKEMGLEPCEFLIPLRKGKKGKLLNSKYVRKE
jgi:hypothetical protein